jgi:hypothetical protein
MVTQHAICARCRSSLEESPNVPIADREPCPKCGSKDRDFAVGLSAEVEVKSTLGAKAYEPGRRKPFLEHRGGDSFFHRAAKWVIRIMRIDRRGNRYTEHVYDPKTGETIHHCDEPLSEHQGHGAAKERRDV